MKITIRVEPRIEAKAEPRDGFPRFEPLPAARGRFPLAMTISLVFHLAGGAAAPPVLDFLDQWSKPIIDFRRAVIVPRDAMPLLVRMPEEPLLVRMPKLRAEKAPRLRSIKVKTRTKAEKETARRRTPAPVLRNVQQQAQVATAILVQPKLNPVKIEEVPDLRSLAVWTGRSPKPGAAPVPVGAVEPVPSVLAPSLRTAPELPIPEPVRSAIPATPLPAQLAIRPKLVLPPSGSSPLQAESPRLEEPVIPPGSTMAGESAAIIALSTMSAKPGDILAVPPGSLVVIGSEGGQEPPKPPQAQNAMPEAVRKAPAERAKTEGPKPPAEKRNADNSALPETKPVPVQLADARATQTNLRGSPGPSRTSDSPSAGELRNIRTVSGDIRMQTAADGTVSLTYPSDGSFDVVVVESSLPEDLAQFGQTLSGRPVHTAYINVGSAREWVLQYCLPRTSAGAASQQGMVVTLDAPAPLKAPYVLRATLPAERTWRSPGYQVFHGLLNVAGRIEQVRVVRAGSASALLLNALSNWLFRPATAGGVAKAVEILLVVPPRAGP